jgi:hypothetical protein
VDLLVDPVQVGLELLGGVRDRAQHAEASRAGDRGDHVTAVREGEDRILHLEHLGSRRLHQHSSEPRGSLHACRQRVPSNLAAASSAVNVSVD